MKRVEIRGVLRAPALHFVVIGALLFALERAPQAVEPGHAMVREPIVITAVRRAQIRDVYTRETGLPVTAADEKALLDREIADELLYREALAHGLHLHDRSIQWRLISKMGFLADDESSPAEPGEAPGSPPGGADGHGAGDPTELYRQALELGLDRDDVVIKRILVHKIRLLIRLQATDDTPDEDALRAFYHAHASDFLQPSRVTFVHLFASREKRGERAETDVRTLLAELQARPVPLEEAVGKGDRFPLGHDYRSRSRARIAKIFGDEFAGAVIAAEPDRWSGPFRSAYGWHAVWVKSREAERAADFDTVRSQVFQRYVNERRTAHLEETLTGLRDEYEVVIEPIEEEKTGS